jgi:hypothetical protein
MKCHGGITCAFGSDSRCSPPIITRTLEAVDSHQAVLAEFRACKAMWGGITRPVHIKVGMIYDSRPLFRQEPQIRKQEDHANQRQWLTPGKK